jgi:hypothetical protein
LKEIRCAYQEDRLSQPDRFAARLCGLAGSTSAQTPANPQLNAPQPPTELRPMIAAQENTVASPAAKDNELYCGGFINMRLRLISWRLSAASRSRKSTSTRRATSSSLIPVLPQACASARNFP